MYSPICVVLLSWKVDYDLDSHIQASHAHCMVLICHCNYTCTGPMVPTIHSGPLWANKDRRVSNIHTHCPCNTSLLYQTVHVKTDSIFTFTIPSTFSPPLPDTLSEDLKDLLSKLLEKDQKKRITIPEIRKHPWIVKSSRQLPCIEENCNAEISVSEEDMEQAFKTYQTPIHILVSDARL